MPIITLNENTINIDGKSIQDIKQEEILNISKDASFNETNLVSRCLSAIKNAYSLREKSQHDDFGLNYLSDEFPDHNESWEYFKAKSQEFTESVKYLDIESFASQIFDVEKPQELEISELASQYIIDNSLAESVLKTNMQTGIINLTSASQIREEVLQEFTSAIDTIKSKSYNLLCEISNYREEHDLYEEDYDDDYYDDEYDYYDDDEYYDDYYDEELSFDDNQEYIDQESKSKDLPIEQHEVLTEQNVKPLHDDDPWCDD